MAKNCYPIKPYTYSCGPIGLKFKRNGVQIFGRREFLKKISLYKGIILKQKFFTLRENKNFLENRVFLFVLDRGKLYAFDFDWRLYRSMFIQLYI